MTETTPEKPKKKSDLIPRLITAAVAIPVLLGIIFYAPSEGFFALVAVAGAISAWEYVDITYGESLGWMRWLVAALTLGVMSAMYFVPEHTMAAFLGAMVVLFLTMLFGYDEQERATHELGSAVTAIVYGGLMLGCVALMRKHVGAEGPAWVVVALGIIWGSDTGAYFAGRAFGKHKLYPAVSPNKTIEGALGGVVTAVLFTFGFDALFQALGATWTPLEPWQVFALAIPANLLGQTGDLIESLVKRAHGVKDSGTIVYGHGGMLDRIDALIFAGPWFYYFVVWFTQQAHA